MKIYTCILGTIKASSVEIETCMVPYNVKYCILLMMP